MHLLLRRLLVGSVALWLGLLLAAAAAAAATQEYTDARSYVGELRLDAALQTFRPSERAGLAKAVPIDELDPDRSVRSDPVRCAPLSLLTTGAAVGGESWTGINGSPAEPVNTLTVRYADAATARAELTAKRLALFRCRTVALTFPPFNRPAATYRVLDPQWARFAIGDQVSYALTGEGRRYEFYVRRFSNTLTWSYGDDVSEPAVRHEVVDDLIRRLAELQHE